MVTFLALAIEFEPVMKFTIKETNQRRGNMQSVLEFPSIDTLLQQMTNYFIMVFAQWAPSFTVIPLDANTSLIGTLLCRHSQRKCTIFGNIFKSIAPEIGDLDLEED